MILFIIYIYGLIFAAIVLSDMRRIRHKTIRCILWPIVLAAMIIRDILYIIIVLLIENRPRNH